MNGPACIRPEDVAAVLALPADDPRRAHVDACPRCRALATAYHAFVTPAAPAPGARPDDADARLDAWRESWLDGGAGAAREAPEAPRTTAPAPARAPRPWWADLFRPALRPVWAFAAVAVVAGGVWLAQRPVAPTLRGDAREPLTLETARWQSDGGVRLAWHGPPDAVRYEVSLSSTALEPLLSLDAGRDTVRVIAADALPAAARAGQAVLWRVTLVRADGSRVESAVGTLSRR